MPNVLVVAKGHHNYEHAKAFGELKIFSEGTINIFSTSNMVYAIEHWVNENYSEGDYLLTAGHILPNAVAFHAILKKYGSIKILVWIGNQSKYKAVTLFDIKEE